MKNLILRHCTRGASEAAIPRWEQDYRLQPLPKLGLFYEYLEMGKSLEPVARAVLQSRLSYNAGFDYTEMYACLLQSSSLAS